VVAPLLMIGAAMGGIESRFLPDFGAGFWPLVSMGATLAGTMRVPFTAVVFALELTNDFNMLMPLLVACFCGYAVTAFALKRSILTEKIARRGYHLTREYSIDPLEIFFVREVMRTKMVVLPAEGSPAQIRELMKPEKLMREQRLFPVVDDHHRVIGVVPGSKLFNVMSRDHNPDSTISLTEIAIPNPVVAFPNESLRTVANRMAEVNLTRLPVVDEKDPRQLVGILSLEHLLHARIRNLREERTKERILRLRLPLNERKSVKPSEI